MTQPATEAKAVYAASAFRSLPRLLSLQDRNPLSPTYGCFHRDYWLYKTSDFPDAVRQFAVHALALAYTHNLEALVEPSSGPPRYYRNSRLRDWAIAGLDFWTKIQHADGSFDEFYPYERGWVGPTAFTTYAATEAYRLLRNDLLTSEVSKRVETAIRRAAHFITTGEAEKDFLANHHAMAYLAVATAAEVLNDNALRAALPALWREYLHYHNPEGWSREYDGPDPGYLSATVSFLAKTRELRSHPSPAELSKVLAEAVDFCSYFVYPDGSYSGTIGSRNTAHFYPHGFELLAPDLPLAASVAERMSRSLAEGRVVPPEIMSDRYVHYRVPEFLLAALDAKPRPPALPPLPFERRSFVRVFPYAGMVVARTEKHYTIANLKKGGVVKSFDCTAGKLLLNDTGWLGKLADGRLVTSQWIDPDFHHSFQTLPKQQSAVVNYNTSTDTTQSGSREMWINPDFHHSFQTLPKQQSAVVNYNTSTDTTQSGSREMWCVWGTLHAVPATKLFTLPTNLLFRVALLLLGWSPAAAHRLKGHLRKKFILESRPVPCGFTRTLELDADHLTVTDELNNHGRLPFRRLLLGGDIAIRYVPQSRFFQAAELETQPRTLKDEELQTVNAGKTFRVVREIALASENRTG